MIPKPARAVLSGTEEVSKRCKTAAWKLSYGRITAELQLNCGDKNRLDNVICRYPLASNKEVLLIHQSQK
jgi:hypothetical protein